MRDTKARFLGFSAIVLAAGSYAVGHASADSLSEPDAYAVKQKVQLLEDRIEQLESAQTTMSDVLDTTADNVVVLDNRTNDESVLGCLAYSDFHYYKERVGAKGPKVRLPVMVWNSSLRSCRASDKAWRPHGRALTPVLRSP